MITRTQLAYFIAPKSGPVRRMETLHDATQALLNDLPYGFQKPRHWLDAGLLVVRASETGLRADILRATDALFDALSHEGWMGRNSVSAKAIGARTRVRRWLTASRGSRKLSLREVTGAATVRLRQSISGKIVN